MSTLMSRDMNITRPTSKVMAPPGGKSSFSLGGDPAPVKVAAPVMVAPVAPSPVAIENVPVPAAVPVAAPGPVVHRAAQSSMGGLLSQDSTTARPAVRVRQAPGGTSSFVLG